MFFVLFLFCVVVVVVVVVVIVAVVVVVLSRLLFNVNCITRQRSLPSLLDQVINDQSALKKKTHTLQPVPEVSPLNHL